MGRFPLPLSLVGTLIGLSRLFPSFLRRSGEIVREWLSRDLLLGSAHAVDWHSSGSEAILRVVSALICCLTAVPNNLPQQVEVNFVVIFFEDLRRLEHI